MAEDLGEQGRQHDEEAQIRLAVTAIFTVVQGAEARRRIMAYVLEEVKKALQGEPGTPGQDHAAAR
jgi:hypothetical protein